MGATCGSLKAILEKQVCSHSLFPSQIAPVPFQKGDDRVKSLNFYDDEIDDRNGRMYNQQRLVADSGHFCFDAIVQVYKKAGLREKWSPPHLSPHRTLVLTPRPNKTKYP